MGVQKRICLSKGLAFHLSSWEVISKPWNVLPDKSAIVYLEALGHTTKSNNVIYGGALGHIVRTPPPLVLEIKGQLHDHLCGQSYLQERLSSIKLDYQGSGELLWWAVFHLYQYIQLLGKISTPCDSPAQDILKLCFSKFPILCNISLSLWMIF